MKSLKLILVAILIISSGSVFSQEKENILLIETNDTIDTYIKKNIKIGKIKKSDDALGKLNLKEAEKYFNSILQKFNLNVSSISGGGVGNMKIRYNMSLGIKYGTLELDENFKKLSTGSGKKLFGQVLGVDLRVYLKKENNFNLFLITGNNWIKIDNGNNMSSFRIGVGIMIKN